MQSKLLAFLLIVEGTWTGTAAGALYAMEHERAAYWMQLIGVFAANATAFAYLLFMGTLDTPAKRVLGSQWGRITLLILLIALILDLARRPHEVVLYMFRPSYALWEARSGDTGIITTIFPWTLLLGLGLAVWAWLRATPGTPSRDRSFMIMLAFLVRDILWFILTLPVANRMTFDPANIWVEIYIQGHGVATGLFALLLAYGILHHQILDIDLKIKLAVERSTLLAVFTGIVFVTSELVEQILDVQQLIPAILVAGLVTIGLRPLQRMAAKVADAAMPNVQDTAQYRLQRGREVYRAALEAAREDGEVTAKERSVLLTLAEQLGLSVDEALDEERAALRGPATT